MTDETVTIGFRAEVSGLKKSLKEAEAATEDLKKEVEETQDAAANKSTGLKGAFGQVSDKIGAAKGKLGSMAGKLKGLAAPLLLAGAAITGATIAAKKLYAVSAETMRMYDPARAERYTGALIKQTRKLKTTLGAVLAPVFQGFTKALTAITGWVNGFFETILKAVGYIQGLLGITQSVNETITNTVYDAADAAEAASAGLASFDNVATLNFGEMGDMDQAQRISELMKQSAESGARMRKSISDALAPVKEIHKFFTDLWSGEVWEGFAASAGNAWDTIKAKGGEVLGGIGETVSNTWENIKTTVGEKLGEIKTRIEESFKEAFETVKNVFNRVIDPIKKAVQWLIDKLKEVVEKLDIVGKAKDLGGKASDAIQGGFNWLKGHIPGLASGGVVEPNAPMLAVVGDNMREREVVSPLSTIRQAVSEALAAQGGNAQGGNIELTVNLDGRTIARGTYDYLRAEAARRGTDGGW